MDVGAGVRRFGDVDERVGVSRFWWMRWRERSERARGPHVLLGSVGGEEPQFDTSLRQRGQGKSVGNFVSRRFSQAILRFE